MGGAHWSCFSKKPDNSFYIDSFGGYPDKFLLNQLPKPEKIHYYKIQDLNSRLFDGYCLYFFYLIKLMVYYDAVLKKYFTYLSMPINVIGNSSKISVKKLIISIGTKTILDSFLY